jgi:hypothetical protein
MIEVLTALLLLALILRYAWFERGQSKLNVELTKQALMSSYIIKYLEKKIIELEEKNK